jgi:RNA polymerase sigma-70 factor (ECF subfamily)
MPPREKIGTSVSGRPDAAPVRHVEHDHRDTDLAVLLRRVLPEAWDASMTTRDRAELDDAVRSAWKIVFFRVRADVADPRDAEEIAQEVFSRVLARLSSLPPDQEVRRSYLVVAARNLLFDQWRRQDRARKADLIFAGDPSAYTDAFEEDPFGHVPQSELADALRALPSLQRRILQLRIIEGLSANETGALVGKRADSVRQIQHRALATLRVALTDRTLGEAMQAGLRSRTK